MKILEIRFKNLNSLKGEHTINFANSVLNESGLFAITGPTGAGKSTILDAITLALYNRIPRINRDISKALIENTGAILTRGTKDCYAELDYEVKGKAYRASWSIAYNRNNNLNDYRMDLASLPDETPLVQKKSECPKMNEELTGLSFDQFVKSILLSQGEFARFLKANRDERSKLLEKITGSFDYRRISIATFQRYKEELAKRDAQKDRIGQIELLDSEQLDVFQKQKAELDKIISQLSKDLKIQLELQNDRKQLDHIKIQKKQKQVELESVKKESLEAESDRLRLSRHKKILFLQADIKSYVSMSDEVRQKQIKLKDSLEYKGKLAKEIERLNAKQKSLEGILTEKQKEYTQQEGIWEKVGLLDKKIDSDRVRFSELKKKFQQLNNQLQLEFEKQKKVKDTIVKNEGKSELILKELDQNKTYEGLSSDISALEVLTRNLTDSTSLLRNRINENRNFKDDLRAQSIEMQCKTIEGFKEDARNNLEIVASQLIDKNLTSEYYNELNTQLENLIRLISEIAVLVKELADRKKQLEVLKLESKKANEQRDLLDKEHKIKELKVQELQVKKERLTLEATFDDHRANLLEGTPCPLCGSMEHPLGNASKKDMHQAVNQELLEEIKRLESITTKRSDQRELFAKTQNSIELLTKEIKSSSDRIHEKDVEISALRKEIKDKYNTDVAQKNSDELQVLKKRVIDQSELHIKYQKLDQGIDRLSLFDTPIANYRADKANLDQALHAYSALIPKDEKSPVDFLKQKALNFEAMKKEFEELKSKIQSDQKIYAEANERLKSQEKDLQSDKQNLTSQEKELSQLNEDRKELFGNKKVDEQRNLLLDSIAKQKEDQAKLAQHLAKAETDLSNTDKIISELNSEISQTQEAIRKLEGDLLPKLKDQDIDEINEAGKILLEESEALRLEKYFEDIKERETRIVSNIKQFEHDMSVIQSKYEKLDEAEEINSKIAEIEKDLNAQQENRNAIVNTIQNDQRQREKQKELLDHLERLEKEFAKWRMLNDYIGSADGKKFTIYAQEIVLQNLLLLANQRLKKLSGRYYFTKTKGDDGDDLFVVDTYMGNVRRSVRTLSGGESFLMSLALALSLSDMAGKNARVESLFIDEGFGTLDEETLDMVMSTLENLQAESNKMIGLISHVPALKERISSQIVLTKGESGYSTIEIIG